MSLRFERNFDFGRFIKLDMLYNTIDLPTIVFQEIKQYNCFMVLNYFSYDKQTLQNKYESSTQPATDRSWAQKPLISIHGCELEKLLNRLGQHRGQ